MLTPFSQQKVSLREEAMRKLLIAIGLFLVTANVASAQYSPLVEQWRPTVEAACEQYGCSPDYLLGIIACESRGVDYIQSKQINPNTGMYDYGLLQISPIWGDIAYADGVSQIWWAAANLDQVWWKCG